MTRPSAPDRRNTLAALSAALALLPGAALAQKTADMSFTSVGRGGFYGRTNQQSSATVHTHALSISLETAGR